MDPDNIAFEEFFAERLKHKGMTLKKLSEMTGISPSHLEEMARGDFSALPSAPYVRGYFMRIGKILDFDGEEWWSRIKQRGLVQNAGPHDAMPVNRFLRQSPVKAISIGVVIFFIVVYLIIQFPKLSGKPDIVVISPQTNPYTTTSNTITIAGTVENADSLSLNGDQVTIRADGSWQKDVLLENGENSFAIAAKKFLGGETDIIEQVIYEPAAETTTTATGTDVTSSIPANATQTTGTIMP